MWETRTAAAPADVKMHTRAAARARVSKQALLGSGLLRPWRLDIDECFCLRLSKIDSVRRAYKKEKRCELDGIVMWVSWQIVEGIEAHGFSEGLNFIIQFNHSRVV